MNTFDQSLKSPRSLTSAGLMKQGMENTNTVLPAAKPKIDGKNKTLLAIKLPKKDCISHDKDNRKDVILTRDLGPSNQINSLTYNKDKNTNNHINNIRNNSKENQLNHSPLKRFFSKCHQVASSLYSSAKNGVITTVNAVTNSAPVRAITDITKDIYKGIVDTAKFVGNGCLSVAKKAYNACGAGFKSCLNKVKDFAMDYFITPVSKLGHAIMDKAIRPAYEFAKSVGTSTSNWVASKFKSDKTDISKSVACENAKAVWRAEQEKYALHTSAAYVVNQGAKPVNVSSVPTASFETQSLYTTGKLDTPEKIAEKEAKQEKARDEAVKKYLKEKDFASIA